MNFDREALGLDPIIANKEEIILVSKAKYEELLIIKGRYEELKKINDKLMSLLTPKQATNLLRKESNL